MSEELAKKAYSAYGQTTDFKNYQGLPMPEWENLPDTIKLAWQNAATAIASPEEKIGRCRCYWEVVAGVIPGTPEPEYTKRFAMTTEEYESEKSQEIFIGSMVKALEYARSLHQPQNLNWVNLQWVWC